MLLMVPLVSAGRPGGLWPILARVDYQKTLQVYVATAPPLLPLYGDHECQDVYGAGVGRRWPEPEPQAAVVAAISVSRPGIPSGEVVVTVCEGKGLKDKDIFGKMDPYCILSCGTFGAFLRGR